MVKKKNKSEAKSKRKSTKSRLIKAIIALFIIIAAAIIVFGYKYYRLIFKVNIDLGTKEYVYLYIPTGSNFETVKDSLTSKKMINDISSFEWLAEKKGYINSIKPGKYKIRNHLTNNTLINILRSGQQEAVKVTFNNIRTRESLSGKIATLIEADSSSICTLLYDPVFTGNKYSMTPDQIMCIFIPNTYEFYWNTSAEGFIDRMHDEYKKFWNNERMRKAGDMMLSPEEVTILASIVDQETKKTDEMSRVAGVYMNRLKKGIPLQADPTVIFALGDFTIKRVLKRHTEYNSPYNTYICKGLPPGPICLPSPAVIDQTLNFENHDYLFFCAKEDFSGYHNFAKTLAQHEENARRYRDALTKQMRKKK